ncbi:hypothetical protein [Paenibacillus sp. DCT19]|uniref:hypothetical protein n=1 Tax=Paenibacillus sp. DCT19 TaxID=2211212 RepID=UPI000FE1BF6B|nr:hypothetical protein [Paenibacillus sp. DCT19]
MSIKRDVNGYKVFDLPNGEHLLWAEEDRVMFVRSSENGTPLTMDPDNEFEDMLVAMEYASVERDRLRKELEEAWTTIRHYGIALVAAKNLSKLINYEGIPTDGFMFRAIAKNMKMLISLVDWKPIDSLTVCREGEGNQ